jgi:formylglycine-generating enzyme required for sulfatase activity
MISRHFVRWTFAVGAILVVMSSPRVSPAAKPETITNGVGMKLVLLPAGELSMGSSPDEIKNWNDWYSWRNPGFKQSDEDPVVCVSWNGLVRRTLLRKLARR